MGQFIIALTKEQAAVLSDNLVLFLAVGAIVAGIVWWLRGSVESSRAEGLKAQLEARNERLSLADERRKDVETNAERLERQVVALVAQVDQRASPVTLQESTALIKSTVTALSTANTALHEALRPSSLAAYLMSSSGTTEPPLPMLDSDKDS